MANICNTEYVIKGDYKTIKGLWATLDLLKVNQKNIWLGDFAKARNIDVKSKKIPVRGEIYRAEYEEKDDYSILQMETESAWTACTEFFDELNKSLGDILSISYREIECGCEIFHVHDEGNYFPEECCVSSSGGKFEDACEDVYHSTQDAIDNWCNIMGIGKGDRKEEYMVDFINNYEYDTEDTFYYIHPFEFD